MATKEGEGSSSSDRENRLMQAVNRCAERFEEGLDMLMASKRNDERLEKAIAGSIERDRENFLHHIAELKKQQDLKDEIKVKIEELIERIQAKAKKYREAAIAQRDSHEEEMRWVESAVDDMISQLSKAAQQVTEAEGNKNP